DIANVLVEVAPQRLRLHQLGGDAQGNVVIRIHAMALDQLDLEDAAVLVIADRPDQARHHGSSLHVSGSGTGSSRQRLSATEHHLTRRGGGCPTRGIPDQGGPPGGDPPLPDPVPDGPAAPAFAAPPPPAAPAALTAAASAISRM